MSRCALVPGLAEGSAWRYYDPVPMDWLTPLSRRRKPAKLCVALVVAAALSLVPGPAGVAAPPVVPSAGPGMATGLRAQSAGPVLLPVDTGAYLLGLTCTSRWFCIGVGSGVVPPKWGDAATSETWSRATGWRHRSVPTPLGGETPVLHNVACLGPSSCLAEGIEGENGGYAGLVVHWDGSRWTDVAAPGTPSGDVLDDVYCHPGVGCLVLGSAGGMVIIDRWTGSGWTAQPVPSLRGQAAGMSCTSSSDCVAVGFLLSPQRPISLQWNGRRWVQLATAPSFINPYVPATISCDPQGTCLSVSSAAKTDESPSHPVSALWDGHKWSALPTPAQVGATSSTFSMVSCVSRTFCMTIGAYVTGPYAPQNGQYLPYGLLWDGGHWRSLPMTAPPVGKAMGWLSGLACSSSSFCMAIGPGTTIGPMQNHPGTQAQIWDGNTWVPLLVT